MKLLVSGATGAERLQQALDQTDIRILRHWQLPVPKNPKESVKRNKQNYYLKGLNRLSIKPDFHQNYYRLHAA